jgi:hypothetical protein
MQDATIDVMQRTIEETRERLVTTIGAYAKSLKS